MAGNFWGADVAQLRTLAQQFGQASDLLMHQSSNLSSEINGNQSCKGADSARFKSEWNGSHRALITCTAPRVKTVNAQASEQEKASNVSTGAGGGPGAPIIPGIPGGNWSLAGLLAGSVGLIRGGMGIHKWIKAPFTVTKLASQYGWVLKNEKTAFI